jgi:predicted ATPase
VLEDLHWADRTTLEYLKELPNRDLRGPLMIVLISRPPLPDEEYLADMLEAIAQRIELGALSAAEARSFIDQLFGSHELDDEFIARVVQRAEGNPLFIEEILKTLVEGEALHVDGEVWRTSGDVEELDVPDSIESVLTTRIDGLDPGAKTVLQYAAIVGRRFWSGVLADALAHRPVERELDNLLQGAFVRALPQSVVKGDREFTFEHLLLQQVAYDGMLRRLRSELHGAVADWLERSLVGGTSERDEWIAFHYLRSKEPHRAAPFLERSARAARAQGALRDAQALVERAMALAAEPDTKADLLLLAEQLAAETGDITRRLTAIEALESLAEGAADERVAAEAAYRRARYLVDSGELAKARKVAEDALAGFENLGDISMQADVLRTLGRISHLLGNFPQALRFFRSSLPLEREAGDRYGQAEVFERLGLVQVDLGNYMTALDHFAAAHDIYAELGDRLGEARLISNQSLAYQSLGEHERAEEVARSALDLADRCGSRQARATAALALARALQARGEGDPARELYRETCETARELGQPALECEAWLGLAGVQTGVEARAAIETARRLAREQSLAHIEILSLTRASEIDLEEGNLAAADAASAAAVSLLDIQGSIQGPEEAILYARHRVLETLGREEEALEAVRRARTIILNRADRIEDPDMRKRYLHSIALNEEILEKSADRPGASS